MKKTINYMIGEVDGYEWFYIKKADYQKLSPQQQKNLLSKFRGENIMDCKSNDNILQTLLEDMNRANIPPKVDDITFIENTKLLDLTVSKPKVSLKDIEDACSEIKVTLDSLNHDGLKTIQSIRAPLGSSFNKGEIDKSVYEAKISACDLLIKYVSKELDIVSDKQHSKKM